MVYPTTGLQPAAESLSVSSVNTPTLTRRRVVIGTTALAVGGAGLALGTGRAGAQADVSLGELKVPDTEFSPDDGQVYSPWVLLSGEWQYRVQTQPAEWQAYTLIGDGAGNTEAVDVTSDETTALEASGTYALTGPIAAASFYGPETFTVPEGESSVSVDVPLQVAFVVRDPDGGILVQARVKDTAVVTVTAEGTTTAALSGTGTIVAQEDSDDPTPTPPGGS